MNGPIRVLHVFGRTGRGGAESRVMDLYRAISRERVQFDFLVHADASATGKRAPSSEELMACRPADDYDEEILALGGRIYALPRLSVSPLKTDILSYRGACEAFFKAHRDEWRVVQGHMTSTAAVYLAAAKRAGVPVTIAHARSAGVDPGPKGAMTRLLRRPLADAKRAIKTADGRKKIAVDWRFACSAEAARVVFGDAPAVVVPNAVSTEKFRFRPGVRTELRSALKLEQRFVIGHVGSFRYAKNHEFLLRVFKRLSEETDADRLRLLLVGSGGLLADAQAQAAALGIREQVIFAGNRGNVSDYYQAMDVFAFPSRYEGVPGSVIEAQAAALPCLVSDRVARDVDVTTLVRRLPIGGSEEEIRQAEALWVRELAALIADREGPGIRLERSGEVGGQIAGAGYDAARQAERLERFYLTGEPL